ncbi:hypothetical protein [Actinopolymorpha pittospori]|uniref:Uncharacterized protein n=1 Tax=Actinopolymorpha pittospori TaxID=648752 RepID=A0A927MYD1_9ACTN|nr:hypothetical protein [Actinopolymorpha pittospori]MBE1605577.1 hypothetical protein [Actinopolymorpha pittospori]
MESSVEPDAYLVLAMTEAAQRVLSDPAATYRIAHDAMAELLPLVPTARHGGVAYSMWGSLADLQGDPRGPQSERECILRTRLAAEEWLATDSSRHEPVAAYFARWDTRTGPAWD